MNFSSTENFYYLELNYSNVEVETRVVELLQTADWLWFAFKLKLIANLSINLYFPSDSGKIKTRITFLYITQVIESNINSIFRFWFAICSQVFTRIAWIAVIVFHSNRISTESGVWVESDKLQVNNDSAVHSNGKWDHWRQSGWQSFLDQRVSPFQWWQLSLHLIANCNFERIIFRQTFR